MTSIMKYVYFRLQTLMSTMRTCRDKSILFNVTSYILRNDPIDATLGQGWRYCLQI